jgi:hypothetical protein
MRVARCLVGVVHLRRMPSVRTVGVRDHLSSGNPASGRGVASLVRWRGTPGGRGGGRARAVAADTPRPPVQAALGRPRRGRCHRDAVVGSGGVRWSRGVTASPHAPPKPSFVAEGLGGSADREFEGSGPGGPGGLLPRGSPTDSLMPFRPYGSSHHELAAGRFTEGARTGTRFVCPGAWAAN